MGNLQGLHEGFLQRVGAGNDFQRRQLEFVQQVQQRVQGFGLVLDLQVAVGEQFAGPCAARAGRLQILRAAPATTTSAAPRLRAFKFSRLSCTSTRPRAMMMICSQICSTSCSRCEESTTVMP